MLMLMPKAMVQIASEAYHTVWFGNFVENVVKVFGVHTSIIESNVTIMLALLLFMKSVPLRMAQYTSIEAVTST